MRVCRYLIGLCLSSASLCFFFFSSRRRHTRFDCDWSSDVCSSDLNNFMSLVVGNQYTFGPNWVGSFVFNASGLHLTATRNANLGFALAFPFTSTLSTISGVETFGDNQFFTPITAFPVLRNQEKYQLRYDLSHVHGRHAPRFGVNFIHEPVLSGALAATAETVLSYTNDPSFYAANPSQFYFSSTCAPPVPADVACEEIPAVDACFSHNSHQLEMSE